MTCHIQGLEDDLGAHLVDRNRRAVALTEAGAAFVLEARSGFEQVRLAGALAARMDDGELRQARIGHDGAIAAPLLQRALPALAGAYPGIEIHLHDAPTHDLLTALRQHSVDIALIRPPAHDPDIEEEHLIDEPVVAVVPTDHPFARRASIDLGDLDGQHAVLAPHTTSPGSYERLVRGLRGDGSANGQTAEGTSTTSLLILVAAHLGVAVLPLHSTGNLDPDTLRAVPITDAHLPLHVAWRRTDENPILFAIRKQLLLAAQEIRKD